MNKYYLYVFDSKFLDKAHQLASFTNFITVVSVKPQTQFYLQLDMQGLSIVSSIIGQTYIAGLYTKLAIRQQNLKNEPLVQAMKLDRGSTVWDLTAGFGMDAVILASFGYTVTMVEKDPILATVLYYAINNRIIPAKNLQLIFANSLHFLAQSIIAPDAIYLDPMFDDNKTSKSKKDMQIIQGLTTNDLQLSNVDLFKLSYAKAKSKVIIKRDNKQPNIINLPKPSHSKLGKTIRFDIYNIT